MKISNGKVFLDGKFVTGVDVKIDDDSGKILEIGNVEADVEIDATGKFVIPGLIDIHFHGCVGSDFCDGSAEAIEKIAKYQISQGVTSICPATMTFSEEILIPIMKAAREFEAKQQNGNVEDVASLVGINMEGPYISPKKVGAQNPKYVRPGDIDEFKRLQNISGNLIKLVDIAPEEEGGIEFAREASNEGVVVSIAHTCADFDVTKRAFDAGARQMTHLFNAMNPIHHRNPGPVIAASEDERIMAELICDGIHSHPAIIRTAFKLFGDDRIILISDSMRACGLKDGIYDLGGQNVEVKGALATIEGGAIAGSVTNLADCLRYAVKEAKIPIESAVKCATENPAKAVGLDDKIGSIKNGLDGDLVLLNDDLSLFKVIQKGRCVKSIH